MTRHQFEVRRFSEAWCSLTVIWTITHMVNLNTSGHVVALAPYWVADPVLRNSVGRPFSCLTTSSQHLHSRHRHQTHETHLRPVLLRLVRARTRISAWRKHKFVAPSDNACRDRTEVTANIEDITYALKLQIQCWYGHWPRNVLVVLGTECAHALNKSK